MGKSSRKLLIARKECYEDESFSDVEDSTVDICQENLNKEYDYDSAVFLYDKIMEYVKEGYYPMCEYLNLNDVERFLQWILEQY